MSDVIVRSQHGLTTSIEIGAHRLVADEPEASGGADLGPNPYELLLSALGACTAMTVQLYAQRKGWALGAVHVSVTHARHASEIPADRFDRRIEFAGDLDDAQRARLLEIAEKCPVHRMLVAGTAIVTTAVAPVGA